MKIEITPSLNDYYPKEFHVVIDGEDMEKRFNSLFPAHAKLRAILLTHNALCEVVEVAESLFDDAGKSWATGVSRYQAMKQALAALKAAQEATK